MSMINAWEIESFINYLQCKEHNVFPNNVPELLEEASMHVVWYRCLLQVHMFESTDNFLSRIRHAQKPYILIRKLPSDKK